MFLYERIDKSKLDKSALFTFDSIPFFGCPILDFLLFFIVYEIAFFKRTRSHNEIHMYTSGGRIGG